VPERVVDELEPVEVAEEDSSAPRPEPVSGQHCLEAPREQAAVGQAGEGVVVGLVGEPSSGARALDGDGDGERLVLTLVDADGAFTLESEALHAVRARIGTRASGSRDRRSEGTFSRVREVLRAREPAGLRCANLEDPRGRSGERPVRT
jgi:hypothetical protein